MSVVVRMSIRVRLSQSDVRCRCAKCHGERRDIYDNCRPNWMISQPKLVRTSWVNCVS